MQGETIKLKVKKIKRKVRVRFVKIKIWSALKISLNIHSFA